MFAFQDAACGYITLLQIATLKQAGNQKQKEKEQKAWVETSRNIYIFHVKERSICGCALSVCVALQRFIPLVCLVEPR